ncbi:hypothetical protein D3C84_1052030 [compost metagenome]
MGGLELFGMLAGAFIEQAAFSDEGLIQIAVGIQQQTDGGQVTFGQAGTGVGYLADTQHSQAAHEHQQYGEQKNRQGNLPAKSKVGE